MSYFPGGIDILELRDTSEEETIFVLFGTLRIHVPQGDLAETSGSTPNTKIVDTVNAGGVYTQAAGVAKLGGLLETVTSCQLLIANSEELTRVILKHKVLRGILHKEAERQFTVLLPLMPPPPEATNLIEITKVELVS
jgi:hypothetical protein